MLEQRSNVGYKPRNKKLDIYLAPKAKLVLKDNLSPSEYEHILDPYNYLSEKHADAVYPCIDYLLEFDKYLFYHSLNVGIFSVVIGKIMQLEHYEYLLIGGILHDIGKALLPSSVLYSSGELTEERFKIIKKHPLLGSYYLRKNKIEDPIILDIVMSHHVYYDRSGYPKILCSQISSKHSQIITISDAFEAICSNKFIRGKTSKKQN